MPDPAAALERMMTFDPDVGGGRAGRHNLNHRRRHYRNDAADVMAFHPEPRAAAPDPVTGHPVLAGARRGGNYLDDRRRHRPLDDDRLGGRDPAADAEHQSGSANRARQVTRRI
jgi:hypothetical protein